MVKWTLAYAEAVKGGDTEEGAKWMRRGMGNQKAEFKFEIMGVSWRGWARGPMTELGFESSLTLSQKCNSLETKYRRPDFNIKHIYIMEK